MAARLRDCHCFFSSAVIFFAGLLKPLTFRLRPPVSAASQEVRLKVTGDLRRGYPSPELPTYFFIPVRMLRYKADNIFLVHRSISHDRRVR